jgi:siroheme synthase
VIVVMALLRKAYHLESYIKPIHFNNIGIFLMAMTNLAYILERLVKNNKPRSTPVAVITHGTTSRQRCVIGTLQDILSRVESEKLQPPVVVVVGEVVRLREYLRWFDK